MFPASEAPTPPKTKDRDMFDNAFAVLPSAADLSVDPVQDSGNKIEEVLKAYGRYQGNRKGKPMSFSKFFELYSTENFAEGGQIRQNFGDGTITPVKNLSKNITGNNLKLFNEGNLYTLRLGADKTQYFGTQKDLQTIFDARPTSGGDTTLELENKKYSKGYKTKNQFIDFLKTKGINIQNPAAFASTYSITTKVNPYKANALIYDTSKLKNKTFVENIIKRQVKSGYGTDAQKAQYKKFDTESVMKRYFSALRRKMQKKYSVRKIEEILSANKASGLNLSHMDDLYSQHVTTRNIGYVPKDFNSIELDKFDKKFREIYKKRNNLFKNKTKGWEAKVANLNKDGVTLAKASNGFKQFIVKKVDGKTRVVGVDLSKTIDPDDILKGKKIKDLSDEDIDLLIENKNKIIKNTKPGTFKKLLKGFGKKLPLAGVILGINEAANASEMGLNDLESLFIAYQTDADTAMRNMEMKDSPFYNKKTLAGIGGYTGGDELPEIDPYQAAKGGLIPDQEIMNYANGGRINYENGSPRGPNEPEGDDFLNELEFKFNNIDSVTIDDTPTTFDDSKSKIAQVADLADPRNIPYYADMAGQAALRVGEFGARVLPATGNLISDILQKPMFKTPSSYERTENYANMVDDTEAPGETQQGAKFVGGPIFKNFLKNITPTSTEKLVGLDTLINEEKKKMIARGSSSLPVKVAETASLGAELVAPIFPGLKILRAYASAKGVKPTKEVAKTMEKEIDQMAASRGMNRREFLVATGAVGTLGIAKLLGISSELPKIARTAEAVTSVAKTADGVPQYLYNLRNVIRLRGQLQPSSSAFLDGQEVYTYKGVTLYHNTYPKDGSFRIAKEFETDSIVPGEPSYNKVEMEVSKGEDIVVDEGFETQKVVKAGDEYEEATAFPAREGGEDVDFYVEDDFHKQLEEISKELDEINQKVEMFGFDK
jgi:hypothetical protein